MDFGLESASVVLDGVDFAASREVNSDQHYFDARIDVKGSLNFGVVPKGQEVQIDLEANGISTPIIIDSIIALAENSTADEIFFYLYKKTNSGLVKVGTQRYSSGQMPIDFPDGVIGSKFVVGAKPTRADSTIVVYVKPVKVLFTAVPNPA
ncbi:MAG: hypothetical protein AAFQ41_03095 [Cyanobacteria bacterium J06623_7]